MINSSVFYLVRGAEEATIKSVLKNLHQLLLSSFKKKLCLRPHFSMFYASMSKSNSIFRFMVTKLLLMKPLAFTIIIIKCEKNAIESVGSVSKQSFFKIYFLAFYYTNFTMDIMIKMSSTRTKLRSTAF